MDRFARQWTINQSSYHRWIRHRHDHRAAGGTVDDGPLISIVMPVYNTPLDWLREALASISAQEYPNWQLCVADDGSTEPWVAPELRRWAADDPRISVRLLDDNVGIALASNAALEMAGGEFVALMDHDDVIASHALGTVASKLEEFPDAQFVYTDSDHLDEHGVRCTPFFKPEWDYLRFLGQNFLNHLTVIRADVLREVGGWSEGYDGSQDYDLYLRVVELVDPARIHHVPEILYHWRDSPNSTARANLGAAVRAARRAITHHLERVGTDAEVTAAPASVIFNRIRWRPPDPSSELLVLCFARDEQSVDEAGRRLADALGSVRADVRLHNLDAPGATLGSFINRSVRHSSCETVLVLDAALVAETDGWVEDLVAFAQVPGVGVIGASCATSDGFVYALPRSRRRRPTSNLDVRNASGLAATGKSSGYIANLALDQHVDFVPPDVMVFRRDVFSEAGGFPEDLDDESAAATFCRDVAARGNGNAWTPHVRFRRAADPPEADGRRGDAAAACDTFGGGLPEIFRDDLPNREILDWDVEWVEPHD